MDLMDLQDQLIRLGTANPELRAHLKPVLAMVTATMDGSSPGDNRQASTRENYLEMVRRELKRMSDYNGRHVDAYLQGPDVIRATYRVDVAVDPELQFIEDLYRAQQDEKALMRLLGRKGVPVRRLTITPGRGGEMEVTLHLDTTKMVSPDLSVYGSLELTADAFGQIRQLAGQLRAGGSKFIDAVMSQDPKRMRQQAYLITFAMGVLFSALDMPNEAAMLKRVAAQLR